MKKQWITRSVIVGLMSVIILSGSVYARGNNQQTKRTQAVWMTELNLNTQQMQKINELRDDMQPAMMEIRHQIRKLELELNQLKRSVSPDQDQIMALRKSIFDNETAIQAIQANHRAEIRVLLTADQQIMFDDYGYGQGNASRMGQGTSGMNRGRNTSGSTGNYKNSYRN